MNIKEITPPVEKIYELQLSENELIFLASLSFKYEAGGNEFFYQVPADIKDKASRYTTATSTNANTLIFKDGW